MTHTHAGGNPPLHSAASNFRMPWGKHRGLSLDQVPPDYLLWLLTKPDLSPSLKPIIEQFLDVDQPDDDAQPSPAAASVVLPGVLFRWWQEMERRYSDDDYADNRARHVIQEGLDVLKQLCSEFTNKSWDVKGGAA